jgi:hypothetical protein
MWLSTRCIRKRRRFRLHRRARVIAGRSTGCAGLGLVLLGVVGSVGCSRETFVVPHEKAPEVVALFGEAWSEPIGELRITGGRMEGGIIRVAPRERCGGRAGAGAFVPGRRSRRRRVVAA